MVEPARWYRVMCLLRRYGGFVATTFVDSNRISYKIPDAFLYKDNSGLQSPRPTRPESTGGGDIYVGLAFRKDWMAISED